MLCSMSTKEKHEKMSAAPVDGGTQPVPLRKWLWRSYLRSALIPLLVIELTFLAIYWASTAVVYRENVAAVGQFPTITLMTWPGARRRLSVIPWPGSEP